MWEKERQAVVSAVKEDLKWVEGDLHDFKELRFMRKLLMKNRSYGNTFIAGGCFADIFQGKSFKDLDFWYTSQEAFNKGFDANGFVYQNENCVAKKEGELLVEHIRVRFGTPREILESFDFTVCKFAVFIDNWSRPRVMYHKDFFKDLQRKEIAVETTRELKYETISRIVKYSNKGFKITGSIGQLLIDLSSRYPHTIIDSEDHYDILRQ